MSQHPGVHPTLPVQPAATTHALPSYLQADHLGPWASTSSRLIALHLTWDTSPVGQRRSSAPNAR